MSDCKAELAPRLSSLADNIRGPYFAAERTFQEKVVCLGSPGAQAGLLQASTGKRHCQSTQAPSDSVGEVTLLLRDHGIAMGERPGRRYTILCLLCHHSPHIHSVPCGHES